MISPRGQPGQNGGMLDDPRLIACLATALLTLTGAGLARFAGLPRLGAAALPLALVLGFTLIIGGVQASPRQLGERLPLLALLLPHCRGLESTISLHFSYMIWISVL